GGRRSVLAGSRLRGSYSQRHQPRRAAGTGAGEIRASRQSESRQGGWLDGTARSACPRRRGDRISAPASSWCDPAGPSPAQVRSSVLLGSECCVAAGDSSCEAYTAIAWGVGLSHERSYIAGAECFYSPEGNMCGTVMQGAVALPGSKATPRAKGSH